MLRKTLLALLPVGVILGLSLLQRALAPSGPPPEALAAASPAERAVAPLTVDWPLAMLVAPPAARTPAPAAPAPTQEAPAESQPTPLPGEPPALPPLAPPGKGAPGLPPGFAPGFPPLALPGKDTPPAAKDAPALPPGWPPAFPPATPPAKDTPPAPAAKDTPALPPGWPPAFPPLAPPTGQADFSTPEATVRTFIQACTAKNADLMSQCLSAQAEGELKAMRDKQLTPEQLEQIKGAAEGATILDTTDVTLAGARVTVKLPARGNRPEGNDTFNMVKEGDAWRIRDF
jgi:hypothetical protein